jgi:putative copper resistance protein D
VTQFLDIFGFLTVLLRGLTLAFEALTLGGVIFLFVVAGRSESDANARVRRWLSWVAGLLAVTEVAIVSLNSAILVATTDLQLADVFGAGFWIAGALIILGAGAIAAFARGRGFKQLAPLAFVAILAGSVMSSHSVARLEHRWVLIILTLVHHVASAAWIGGLLYLLVTLRNVPDRATASAISARFSRLAMGSVGLLVTAGTLLAWSYVGSPAALFETTYGVMLGAKVLFTLVLLLLGALNWKIVRAVRKGATPDMLPLRRFAEAEIGIGLTVLLAAASLTSTPPASDVLADRVPLQDIAQRMQPKWPRMQTPPLSELSPASSLAIPQNSLLPGSFLPGQKRQTNNPADIAWSEYNHHWAGLVVLAIGILAVFSRRFLWARYWPLVFLGLAAFLLVRADSENWPLGPRGFWESFQVAEVAQHRVFVLLIVAFAVFEWAVQTHRLAASRAGLVFPLVCAAGGALLLTHSHSLGNVKEEFLAELSHIPLAIFAVVAGWSRWLEIRLPSERPRAIAWMWPVCFVLIGSILMLYRES